MSQGHGAAKSLSCATPILILMIAVSITLKLLTVPEYLIINLLRGCGFGYEPTLIPDLIGSFEISRSIDAPTFFPGPEISLSSTSPGRLHGRKYTFEV
jgi:hypothetical protein